MSDYVSPEDAQSWVCARCNIPLVLQPVRIEYLGNAFPVSLPKCPQCGLVFIPESLALGKMAEVEHALEDK
jgi:hypothetical protein